MNIFKSVEGNPMTIAAEESAALVDLVSSFAREVVAPQVAAYDEAERLPQDILKQMRELGLFGGTVPEDLGGAGLDHLTYAAVIEAMSTVDHCLGVLMSMPSALVGSGLLKYGTAEQKKKWLTPLASGEIFGSAGVTEPQSGSNVAAMETTYRRVRDKFVISGAKTWITNIDIASFIVTFATRDRSEGRSGVSAFVIPLNTPGLSTHPFKNKLGFRPLCSGEVIFDEVCVGADALLGEEGDGYRIAMGAVERGRLSVAARAVGLAQGCLEDSVSYARERVIAGTAIAEHQMTQHKLAQMATEIQAARLLVQDCARAMDGGSRARTEASMAKLYASDVAQRVATEAVQIHGAYGVSPEFRVGRAYRDSKVFQLVEGTNEIHRLLVARALLKPGR
ncbi:MULTISPECIES: acyl-CoA dehydrogenase family protein [unclassified Streptomyces]|uniref:acyl-CoA dehydrogenase family protein n=1 Tax=unclassified Streptomyces TaxID=2593676 RepID=UPI000B81E0F0|nr:MULTISPECIES: acyl-CoA dehydrogenase family protein [unclassified Streptomyces]MYZ36445.1 acyl-CoA dehydrogenase [Streptomyces sp. SID4917]